MLLSIHNFLGKIFKIYISTLKNFVPYIMTFFLLFVLVFFAQFSSILFFTLIPGLFAKTLIYFFGLLLISFFSFMMSIALIRVVNSHYIAQKMLGFFSNLKNSFFLAIKNFIALILLGIPAILIYIIYFVGSMGYLSVKTIILLYLGVIFVGILFVFWLSFVVVAIAIDNQKGLNAFKSSIVTVKGRVWSVFLRLLIPSLLFYILFLVYNEIFFRLFSPSIVYTILVLLFTLFVIPFGAVIPTILYLELKQSSSK